MLGIPAVAEACLGPSVLGFEFRDRETSPVDTSIVPDEPKGPSYEPEHTKIKQACTLACIHSRPVDGLLTVYV